MMVWAVSQIAAFLLTGCLTPRVVVIPEDHEVRWLPPGQTHHTTNGVWLVPDSRMRDILLKLNK